MRSVSAFTLCGVQFCLQSADNTAENDSVASLFQATSAAVTVGQRRN
jgi:hypothetical protein